MEQKKVKIHEVDGQINLIELKTLANCLPVKDETYSRIIYTLMLSGHIQLSGHSRNNA